MRKYTQCGIVKSMYIIFEISYEAYQIYNDRIRLTSMYAIEPLRGFFTFKRAYKSHQYLNGL